MQYLRKNGSIIGILAISAMALVGCTAQKAMHPYDKTNHIQAKSTAPVNHNQSFNHRYGKVHKTRQSKSKQYRHPYDRLRGRKALGAQQNAPAPGPHDMFQRWVDYEPSYALYPGDQIDVVVQSAPEMSRTLTVGPDGRISMPMVPPVMAAGRTLPQIKSVLKLHLAKELRDPSIALTNRAFAPQQIYVGGQVGQQGQYTLTGPIGSLEAIMMAGGFLPSAKSKDVVILRRAPNGGLMMRTINHKNGMRNIRSYADNMQLKRGDIIFVPRNSISEVGVFVQQVRAALPIDLSLSYNLGNGVNGN